MQKLLKNVFILSLFHLSMQVCSPGENYQSCNCQQAFLHTGRVYTHQEGTAFLTRYDSPQEACQTKNRSAATRTLTFNQRFPLPDMGATVNLKAQDDETKGLVKDLPFERDVSSFQFDRIWRREVVSCKFSNPDIVHKGRRLTGESCVLDLDVYVHRRWVTMTGKGDGDNGDGDGGASDAIPQSITCNGRREVNFDESEKPKDCRFYECLEKVMENKAPFNTNEGRFETKEQLCAVYVKKRVEILIDFRNPEFVCKKGNHYVCVDDIGIMVKTDFCDFKRRGYVSEFTECPGGCSQRECRKQNCIKSFKGKYNTMVNVCAEESGLLFDGAEKFCEHNPDYLIYNKLNLGFDPYFPKSREHKDKEFQTQKECCEANKGYSYCDTGDEFHFKRVKSDCSDYGIQKRMQNNNFYFKEDDPKTCYKFKKCMERVPEIEGICLTDGTFYNTKRDLCAEHTSNAFDIKIHDCSFGKDGSKCQTKFECGRKTFKENEEEFKKVRCSTAMDFIWDSEEKKTAIAGFQRKFIDCGKDACGFAQCMETINKEERIVAMAVLTPDYQFFTSPKELLAYQKEMNYGDRQLIHCREDCFGFAKGFKCLEMEACMQVRAQTKIRNPEIKNPEIKNPEIRNPEIRNPEIKDPEIRNPEIRNPEKSATIEKCLVEMSRNKKVCDFKNDEFKAVLFQSVDEYCEKSVERGMTEKFEELTLDCPGDCYTQDDCTKPECFQNEFKVCKDGSAVMPAREFCLRNPSFLEKSIVPCMTNGEQRDCEPADCCSGNPQEPEFYNTSCADGRLVVYKEFQICTQFNNLIESSIMPMPIDEKAQICDNKDNYHSNHKKFCSLKKRNPNVVVSSIFFGEGEGEGDGRFTCCAAKCPDTKKVVIIKQKSGKEKIFQNECFANCFFRSEFQMLECHEGEQEENCKIRNCTTVNQCYESKSNPVCADNGIVYTNKCDLKCNGVKRVKNCPEGANNDIDKRNQCARDCTKAYNGEE